MFTFLYELAGYFYKFIEYINYLDAYKILQKLEMMQMHFYCEKCKKEYPLNSTSYQCSCGGLFRLYKDDKDTIPQEVSIGEVVTPLLPIHFGKQEMFFKMEHLNPTGSFKARGAKAMVNVLKHLGVEDIVEDSSGNGASALAAYAAAANIDCTVYVPESIPAGKLHQIETYGAHVRLVIGNREATAEAAKKAVAQDESYYASHVYNPLFFEGIKSMAYEIYEQLGNKVPEYIFLPVGNGTMLLGLYYGFEEIGRLPAFVAVQSENCCPLYNAFKKKRKVAPPSFTIADAIRVEKPMRLKEMLMAINRSKGEVITVSDEEIEEAQHQTGRKGIYVEATAAVPIAGALKYFRKGKPDNYRVVIPITGAGLNGPNKKRNK